MKSALLIIFLLSQIIFAQTKIYTLEESLQTGLQNSKDLKISQSKVIGSDAKITEVGSQMLPKLSLGASYTKLSDVPPFQVTVPFYPTPIKLQDNVLNNYVVKLSVQQPLFTGFRLISLKNAAELNNKAAQADEINDKNQAALNIQNAFWNYYKAKTAFKLISENLTLLDNHLKDTKNFMDNGLATKNDYLKLQVQRSNTELMKIDAENNLNLARVAFNKAIGVTLIQQNDIETRTLDENISGYKYDDIIKEAMDNRQEIKSLSYKIEAAKENTKAAASGWFPSLYLFGDYNYNRPNQRYMPTKDEFNDTWDVGVSLNWELWNWGHTSSQTTQAEQQVVQAETSFDILKENIEIEVYQNYLKLLSENEKVKVSKLNLEQAEENYRITNDKYNQQLSTSTDLIDADVSLLDAKTKLNNSLVDLEIAKVKLEKSAGRKIY